MTYVVAMFLKGEYGGNHRWVTKVDCDAPEQAVPTAIKNTEGVRASYLGMLEEGQTLVDFCRQKELNKFGDEQRYIVKFPVSGEVHECRRNDDGNLAAVLHSGMCWSEDDERIEVTKLDELKPTCLECHAERDEIHKANCGKSGGAGHVMEEDCVDDE